MVALLTVLAVALTSLLIARVAVVALVLTGMPRETARFQARSALSGTGFTTAEAESMVRHPVRRRIVMGLMLLGSAGLVTAVASLILSFGDASSGQSAVRIGALLAGLTALFVLSRSRWFDRWLSVVVARLLRARGFGARDFVTLLQLNGPYVVSELRVTETGWARGRTPAEIREEGAIVLGILRRDGEYLGVPERSRRIEEGETLVLYGPGDRIVAIDERGRRSPTDSGQRPDSVERELSA